MLWDHPSPGESTVVKSKSYLIAFYNKEYASAAKNVPRKRQIPILRDLQVRPAIEIEVAAGNKKPYVKLLFCCLMAINEGVGVALVGP